MWKGYLFAGISVGLFVLAGYLNVRRRSNFVEAEMKIDELNKVKVLEYLKETHAQSIQMRSEAGSHIIEGFYNGRTNLSYELINKIENGEFG